MGSFSSEGWVKKVQGTYPKAWSTNYQDYGAFHSGGAAGGQGDSQQQQQGPAKQGQRSRWAAQAASVDRLAQPRRPEDHDDIRLLHYPDYYNMEPLANQPHPSRHSTTPGYPRRRAHPGVRLPPLEEEAVEPVHYPSHNHHIRNHLVQEGECLCKFPARPYKDAGAGDPQYLHPVTGRSYKGGPLTWCHYRPSKRKPRPSVNKKLFDASYNAPWKHSFVPAQTY